jgi:hypothetical protein
MGHQSIIKKLSLATLVTTGLTTAAFSPSYADKVTETRDVTGFTKISLNGSMDMEVRVGSGFNVTVTADDRIVGRIETEIDGSTLRVGRERGSRRGFRNAGIIVKVTLPNLESFRTNGSGDAWVEGINSAEFTFDQNGSGDTDLSGKCENGEFEMNGSGDLDARDFDCVSAGIDTNGSGDIELTVTGDVSIDSRGSGDVTLYGEPRIKKLKIRGSGDLDIR